MCSFLLYRKVTQLFSILLHYGLWQGFVRPCCLSTLSLSHVQFFVTPWNVSPQAFLSMGFFRQGYWNGMPLPSPGALPNPGIEPGSPTLQAHSLTSEPPVKSNPIFSPIPVGKHKSVFYIFLCFTVFLYFIDRYVHFCLILDSTCKWYHMICVFPFLSHFP